MYKKHLKKLTLEELPNWSSWPARLLSLDPFKVKHKTPDSITREFGNDKWGKLFQYFINKDEFTLANIEEVEQNIHEIIACFDREIGFYSTTVKEANSRQIEIFKNNLIPYIKDASCLVELGAGYGSKLLSLSEVYPLDKLPLYAAEYTESGCELLKLISNKINKQVKVGNCDFSKLSINNLEIPENSIIFTSYSVHYVPKLKKGFVDFISKLKPKVVVHFEPCYEYFDEKSLHGLMCKRYMQLNDYTQNIASVIKKGCLEIGAKFEEERNIFGANPFLPFTIIKWFPKY
jgi:hypothetical protein